MYVLFEHDDYFIVQLLHNLYIVLIFEIFVQGSNKHFQLEKVVSSS